MKNCFVPAQILLPAADTPLDPWACIAVDQFTSQPEYWRKAEALAQNKPSTLHIVLPEAYLGTEQEQQRTESIRTVMEQYRTGLLNRKVNGFVYLERTQQDGSIRQGLLGAVDLEDYSYQPGAQLAIRPSENTVVSRIPPRLKVRRGATLETPHVMMLANDTACRLIEPIGLQKAKLPLLYEGELMLGGGHLAGWAVEEPALIRQIAAAMETLSSQQVFDSQYPAATGRAPIALAVGDGNHSLATAKAYWEELKQQLTPEQQQNHPARWCLAEVCNLHSPAIEIEPIHRVLFHTDADAVLGAMERFAAEKQMTFFCDKAPQGEAVQQMSVVCGAAEHKVCFAGSRQPLAVGTLEAFLEGFLPANPGCHVDYIHGEQTARTMAQKDAVALLLPGFAKTDLFKGIVLGGVLPRKTFSMGHAEEKRYYNECRSLVVPEIK